MAKRWSLSRVMLCCLIVALSASGLMGIGVFLFAETDDLSEKILYTTLGVSFYSLMALGCAVALERRRAKVVALPGLAICAAGFLYLVLFFWLELFGGSPWWWKAVPILAIFAASFAQASLLSFVQLRRGLSWLVWIAHTSIFWLAILISVMIVLDLKNEELVRAVGVLAIIDGCASLTIPILAKLGGAARTMAPSPYSQIEITCPQCELRRNYPLGQIECEQCGLRLRAEVFVPLDDPPLQFSVRSLLVLTFIVVAGLGLLKIQLGPFFAQWRIARSLTTVGGDAYIYDGNVYSVTFSGPAFAGFPDEIVTLLGECPELESLRFENVAIDDEVISRIPRCGIGRVMAIYFERVRFSNRALSILGKRRDIWLLSFVDTPLTSQDIAALDGCNARMLRLHDTGLTEAELAHLASWPQLNHLRLGGPNITKAGLMRLKKLLRLTALTLAIAPGDKIDKKVAEELNAAWPKITVDVWDR